MYAAGPFLYAFVTHKSYIFEEVIAKHSAFCSLNIAMQRRCVAYVTRKFVRCAYATIGKQIFECYT